MGRNKIIKKGICILILVLLIFQYFNVNISVARAKVDDNNIVSEVTNKKGNNKIGNTYNKKSTKDKLTEENEISKEKVNKTYNATNSEISNFTASKADKIDPDEVFPEDYGWCFKFIEGVTKVETYGMTKYNSDLKFYLSGSSVSIDTKNVVCARLTSTTQKGKIWIKYKNIGTFKGKKVNLKVTLEDWNYLQPARKSGAEVNLGGVNYPCVFFYTNKIQTNVTSIPAIDSSVFSYKFTFEDENKKETSASSLKGHFTFCDIDSGEYFKPICGFDEIYAYAITNLNLSKTNIGCTYGKNSGLEDKTNWITSFFSGDTIKFIYTREQDVKGNKYRDITQTASKKSRSNYAFLTISQAVAPFVNPDIDKQAKKVVVGEEEYEYTIHQFIPGESSDNYYKKYCIFDTLDDSLEFAYGEDTKKIEISDDSFGNLKDQFDIKISGQDITFTAKDSLIKDSDFYNNNIYFKIPVKKKKNYDMSSYVEVYNKEDLKYTEDDREVFVKKGDNVCVVRNKATSEITRKDIVIADGDAIIINPIPKSMKQKRTSNEVETYFFAEISTSAINGEIDDYSSSGPDAKFQKYQPLGTSVKINYEPHKGYTLQSVTVDGKEKDVTKYPDSYKISNLINAKYSVDVVYAKKEVKYTINYYKDGKLQKDDTEIIKESIKLDENSVDIDYSKVNTVDKYKNCVCIKVSYMEFSDSSVITVPADEFNNPKTIGDGGEINIYYISLGVLKIVKTGENLIGTPKVLAGVEFEIINTNTKEVFKGTTDEKGEIVKEVPIGEYEIRELKTVDGYRLDTNTYKVIITSDKEQELSLENKLEFILPNAGGKGSFKFIIAGGICILISLSIYINNKEMKRNNRGKRRIKD